MLGSRPHLLSFLPSRTALVLVAGPQACPFTHACVPVLFVLSDLEEWGQPLLALQLLGPLLALWWQESPSLLWATASSSVKRG